MAQIPEIPVALARRMALHAQGLGADTPVGWGPQDGSEAERIANVVHRIGCLQLDPVSTVARSPLLVLHARIGPFDEASLHEAAYGDRALFEYWCHEASLCAAADLPYHRRRMRRYLEQTSPRIGRARVFLAENEAFARSIVRTLKAEGPLPAAALEDRSAAPWRHGHWTDEVSGRQTVARMLDLLWMTGKIGVADRGETPTATSARRWDLMERCLPREAAASIPAGVINRKAIERAVGMLGVARAPDVRAHFTRNRYEDLPATLEAMSRRGPLTRVVVRDPRGGTLRGPWYARRADLAAAADLAPAARRVALSPFDNVLCDRARTAALFGFDHRLEIYVPPPKRRWGYYVLPILDGERLVARVDAVVDREADALRALTVYREPGAGDAAVAAEEALATLAAHRGLGGFRIERVR